MDFKKIINFFSSSIIIVFLYFLFLSSSLAETSLESYCKDGYYKLPSEPVCSRAPNCGGKSYDEVKNLPQPNPQSCMGDKDGQRSGCRGWVPLCCYEVARTGDFTKCVGYWERLWCSPIQCDQARQRGASDDQCGGNCLCGHAFKSWCKGADAPQPPVPIETRIKGSIPYGQPISQPTPTSTPTPSKAYKKPTSMPITISPLVPTKKPPTPRPTKRPSHTPTPTIFKDHRHIISPTITAPKPTFTPSKKRPVKISFFSVLSLKRIFQNIKTSFYPKSINPDKIEEIDKKISKISFLPVKVIKKIISLDKKLEQKVNLTASKFFNKIKTFSF